MFLKKSLVRYIFLFCSIFLYFQASVQLAHAAGQTFKVMTFNTEFNDLPDGIQHRDCPTEGHVSYSKNKVKRIAQFIKDRGIEVALLQEMQFRCMGKQPSYDEVEGLAQALSEIGYPMYHSAVPYTVQESWFRVATFSRYPIDQQNVRYFAQDLKGDATRWYLVTPIRTDVGMVTFYNLHTRYQEACEGIQQFMQKVQDENIPLRILGGDFNMYLRQHDCGRKELDDYIKSNAAQLDHIIFPKTAPFSFVSKGAVGGPPSSHAPVLAEISTTLPIVAVPTPTPAPTPISCTVQGLKRVGNTTAPVESILGKAKMSIDGVLDQNTAAQPYFVSVRQGVHTIKIENPDPNSYDVGYTMCANRTDCHGNAPTMGSTASVTCTQGYIDLWWHFIAKSKQKPGDVDKDGDVDIFDYNKMIEFFGQDKCEYNFIETCRIDIFDFNAILQNFGK